ncbi:MAG: hypothetical protein MK198_06835 [Gracilimonas sp.]|uniref:hypothetical protein n=1 Tax=Gracilimonas sp. TaxID=1974203 RepID=UPI0037531920|nr:hypothetical protein [Gracilimonas sp.]
MESGIQKKIFKNSLIKDEEKRSILNYYLDLENRISINSRENSDQGTPVNFQLAKKFPRHRWYTYKEGFSPVFVSDFINRFRKSESDVIFDPFGGIGTSVLEGAMKGYNSYSNDINGLSNYIANIKTANYSEKDLSDIKKACDEFINNELTENASPPDHDTVLNYFDQKVLENILSIQAWINNLDSSKTRNLFNLSLITNLEYFSSHRKDGNGVKRKSNHVPITKLSDTKEILIKNIELFIKDIESTKISGNGNILTQSSFDKYELPEKADLVITSPPYANCFDYSKVYLVELWFSGIFKNKMDQKIFRESSIISHVHYNWDKRHENFGNEFVNSDIYNYLSNKDLWDKKIPKMVTGYFSDMGKVLTEMSHNLNKGATVGMVVGNSVYAGLPIATDLLITEMAKDVGYEVEGIEVYRQLNSSPQQMKKLTTEEKKFLRESLIILKWK